jgi:basic membrane lipoprotein Med (substrate-binding protein (PBP1-ABC) superfamily)
MKIRTSLIAAATLAIVVSACGSTASPTPAGAQKFRVAVIMPSAITDVAFSQSMYAALKAEQAKAGGEANFEIKYTEGLFNVPDVPAALRDYAGKGYNLIIAHGSQYGTSVQEVAKDFPKVSFAWGTDVNTYGLPNVYAYTAAAEQGGYVNGVLAAKVSKAKNIGVTGPVEVGDAKTYIDGFMAGVASVDPSLKVTKTWTGSFSDVAKMTTAAKAHITNGADVLTGSSQSVVGSIGAAKDASNVLWFGTQSDQASLAPTLVVASQVYDWTVVLDEMIPAIKAGTLGGKTYTLTLQSGGLKMAYNSGYALAADAKAAGDKAIADIIAGTVKVNP